MVRRSKHFQKGVAILELSRSGLYTTTDIGLMVGLSQGFTAKLLRIMRDTSPLVLNRWQHEMPSVSVANMYAIAQLPRKAQTLAYNKAFAKSGRAGKCGPAGWYRVASDRVTILGKLLRALDGEQWPLNRPLGVDSVRMLAEMQYIRLGKNMIPSHVQRLAKALRWAYHGK